jgi:hypothetical protein
MPLLTLQLRPRSNQQPLAWSVNRASSTSNLLLIGIIPVTHQNSNGCGEYVSINNVKKYGIGYAYSHVGGGDGTYGVLTVQGLWTAAELGTGTGNMTVGVGWTSRNGSNQQLGNYWNPYRLADRREHNQCQMTVFEILGTTQFRTMIAIIRPILFTFLGSTQVKRLIVDLLKRVSESTDNTIDDKAVEFIENGLFPK